MKRITVEIIIPAHNEEKNISVLLQSVLCQSEKDFVIERITVISDGSTDQTAKKVEDFKDKRINLIIGSKREGKMKRLNYAYSHSEADILVHYDADIILPSDKTTYNLIEPMMKDRSIDIVFGRQYPSPPKTLVEKAAFLGFYIWEDAKEMLKDNAKRYRVHGQIRAFARKFYTTYRIPEKNALSEDTYNFFYAMKKKSKCHFSKKAYIYFRLPNITRDYVNQMSRYISIPSNLEKFFDKAFMDTYSTMNKKVLVLSALKRVIMTNPLITAVYVYIHLRAKLKSVYGSKNPLWTINISTKTQI